ncbi:MAG: hypothetical protein KF752_09640 [Pirellulaceae bacterium]|nr:hypothetical protein [Pirellulaceae bacterium]
MTQASRLRSQASPHMGNELGGYEATGGGEAIGLANLCEKAMRFPAIDPKIPDGQLAKQL